ncbi:hypothetical protein BDR04DRAFT_1162785 [Suillus decipiens]|nr:hypothetical protein BDR04DRAFT_1162785 [Suillus decipiens]
MWQPLDEGAVEDPLWEDNNVPDLRWRADFKPFNRMTLKDSSLTLFSEPPVILPSILKRAQVQK